MPGFIKAVIFILMLGALTILGVLLLPLLIVLYLFLPKRSSGVWFKTFSQPGPRRGTRDGAETEEESGFAEEAYRQIPASRDIIDVKAEEVDEKESG